MSKKITAANLNKVIIQNQAVKSDIQQKVMEIRINCNPLQLNSASQLPLQILKPYGLLQVPIDNPHWSGAIFVKDTKQIPVINTAQPRATQNFTAWQEIYHLLYGNITSDHVIDTELYIEEQNAAYFAMQMLHGNLMTCYAELPEMDFLQKVFHCMYIFQSPYKAILVSLYEAAKQTGNQTMAQEIIQHFDIEPENLSEQFWELGLDDSVVQPSFVVNCGNLQERIAAKIRNEPELKYNRYNAEYLRELMKKMRLLVGQIKE